MFVWWNKNQDLFKAFDSFPRFGLGVLQLLVVVFTTRVFSINVEKRHISSESQPSPLGTPSTQASTRRTSVFAPRAAGHEL